MPDMLVKLYELDDPQPLLGRLAEEGVVVRRPLPPEKHLVVEWVKSEFGPGWASECDVTFGAHPVSCFIAVRENEILGFGCYDATCRGFFGPTGVSEQERGRGIGKALLLACLAAMREAGYAYAVIGGAGPTEFYAKHCGATVIEGSVPGIYRGMLRLG